MESASGNRLGTGVRGLLVLLLAALSGCAGRGGPEHQVVARIDGRELRLEEFRDRVQAFLKKGEELETLEPPARQRLLDLVVSRELLVAEGLARGLDREPRLAAECRRTEQKLLIDSLYERVAVDVPEPSAEELQRFFHDQGYDELIRTNQIICTTREEAAEALAALARGEDFAEVVEKYTSPRARQRFGPGGQVPPQLKGKIPEELRGPTLSLQVGQVYPEPVPGPWGFHVVELAARQMVDFDSSRAQVREDWRRQRRGERLLAFNDDLRKRYELRADPQALAQLLAVPPGQLSLVGEDRPLFTWKGGELTTADYLKEVEEGQVKHPAGQDSAGLYRWAENLAGQRIMTAEARRLGLDQAPRLREQVEKRRDELILESLSRSEAVGKVQVTEEDMRAYYEANQDRYRGADGKVKPFESLRKGIAALLRNTAQNRAMDRFIDSLRSVHKEQIETYPEVLDKAFAKGVTQ